MGVLHAGPRRIYNSGLQIESTLGVAYKIYFRNAELPEDLREHSLEHRGVCQNIGVVGRVIVGKSETHPAPFGDLQCCSVGELPVKVVMRNIEDDFFPSVRIGDPILGALAADMRVGAQAYDFHVFKESDIHGRRHIAIGIGRNRE